VLIFFLSITMNRLTTALSLPIGAALLLQANPSHALTTITVGGTAYDVDYFSGSLSDLLASPIAPPSASFPWFANVSLAEDFANILFAAEGNSSLQTIVDNSPTNPDGVLSLGPLFLTSPTAFVAYNSATSIASPFTCDVANAIECQIPTLNWAYVQPATPPVPAPLPLLGATAAFSFSRKLRRRVNAQKFTF
jgi:hypothetical protein